MTAIWRLGVCCFVVLVGWASAVMSAEPNRVVLSLSDGSYAIDGILVDYDSDYYTLQSDFGVLTLLASNTNCLGAACPKPSNLFPTVDIAVSPELAELLIPSLIEDFTANHGLQLSAVATAEPSVLISLTSSSTRKTVAQFNLILMESTDGFRALSSRSVDMAILRRAPTLVEARTLARDNPSALRSQVIGWETLRLYGTHPDQAVGLTIKQLMGKTGAVGETTASFNSTEFELDGDSDSMIALHQVLGRSVATPVQVRSRSARGGLVIVTPNLALPPPLRHIAISANCGVPVGRQEGAFGSNPLEAPLYLYHANVRLPRIARDFMKYTLSLPAQKLVAQSGYVSRTPVEARIESDQGILLNAVLNSDNDTGLADLRATVRELNAFGRLSLTFRYKEGTRDLDGVSRANLGYVADLLQEARFHGREVLFAGFSDSSGNAESNLRLSQSRAETLRDTILSMMGEAAPDPDQYRARGFGEVLPLACNDTGWGQHRNRRVEIWVR